MKIFTLIGLPQLILISIMLLAPIALFIFGYYIGKSVGYAKRARELSR